MKSGIRCLVAIHGAPRSGTSWIGEVFNSHPCVAYRFQPLFSYAFKGRLTGRSSAAEIEQLANDLLATQDDFVLQRGSARLATSTVSFAKDAATHLVYKEVRYHYVLENLLGSCPRAIGLGVIRNPCAVISSWLNAPRDFRPEWDPMSEWRLARSKNQGRAEDYYGFEKWKEIANLFHKLADRYPGRFSIIRYEELVADPPAAFERAFAVCGLATTPEVLAFLDASRAADDHDPYGVFREPGVEQRWRDTLDPRIHQAIRNDLEHTELARYLF